MKEIRIHDLDAKDVSDLIERKVREAVHPLIQEVNRLREEHRMLRTVVSTRVAVHLFDDDVTEETIKDYIRYWGLPAFRRGQKLFMYRQDIEDFQIGKIGYADKRETACMVEPSHDAGKA